MRDPIIPAIVFTKTWAADISGRAGLPGKRPTYHAVRWAVRASSDTQGAITSSGLGDLRHDATGNLFIAQGQTRRSAAQGIALFLFLCAMLRKLI